MAREHIDIDTAFYRELPYASGVKVSGQLLYTAGVTARDDDGVLVGPSRSRPGCIGRRSPCLVSATW